MTVAVMFIVRTRVAEAKRGAGRETVPMTATVMFVVRTRVAEANKGAAARGGERDLFGLSAMVVFGVRIVRGAVAAARLMVLLPVSVSVLGSVPSVVVVAALIALVLVMMAALAALPAVAISLSGRHCIPRVEYERCGSETAVLLRRQKRLASFENACLNKGISLSRLRRGGSLRLFDLCLLCGWREERRKKKSSRERKEGGLI